MKPFADKVCAVVVTYNRKELLLECLESLFEQERAIDSLYIVDNCSTDGTESLLFSKGYIYILPPTDLSEPFEVKTNHISGLEIYYVRMHENTGGAGGFYEGQKRAYERGFDWLWLMDDDGIAPTGCLKTLLTEAQSHNLQAMNPLVLNKQDHSKLSFGLESGVIDLESTLHNADPNGIIYDKANPFNGTLLHKNIMKKCGFIKKEMFIWGDETEYFLRIKKHGFVYATSIKARFFHPESKSITDSVLWGMINVAVKPKRLEFNYYRNIGYINRKYGRYLRYRVIIKYIIYFFLKREQGKAFKFLCYFFDGYFDRYSLPNFQKVG